MRNKFADTFYELSVQDELLNIVVADISPAGSIAKFREQFPERFINTGVSEQIMIAMVAGMAQRGLKPFAYTIATFVLYRPYEMVRDDICYQNLPVTMVGIGGGVTYSTLGATHHAQEDIAIAGSMPNMQILAPCDPLETTEATRWCATENNGPVYLRLGKAGEQNFTENAVDPFEYGKLRYITKGEDVCIVTYGPIIKLAANIAEYCRDKGKTVSLVSAATVKPFDRVGAENLLKRHKKLIVIEETSPVGSVGQLMKSIAYDLRAETEIYSFSLKDEFIHHYGSHDQLLEAHGLSEDQIKAKLGF